MVTIRLKRFGCRNHPFYRIVVADKRAARDGKVVDQVGYYDPYKDWDEKVVIDSEKVKYWLSVGAQPSDRVAQFLDRLGILPEKLKKKVKKKI